MKNCTLNQNGQDALASKIMEVAGDHPGINPSAWFEKAEELALSLDDWHQAYIEIGQQYTNDKNPHLIGLKPEWFDTEEIEE